MDATDPSMNTPKWIMTADISPNAHVLALHTLGDGNQPQVAANTAGDLIAGWYAAATIRPTSRTWCPPVHVGPSDEMQVAIAPNGTGQVIWDAANLNSPNDDTILARTLTPCRHG